MSVIGPIIITITLCPEGCFIPVSIKKTDYYNQKKEEILHNYEKDPERKYHYENMNLEYELNQFSTKAIEELFNHVKNGEFILDNCHLEYINHFLKEYN